MAIGIVLFVYLVISFSLTSIATKDMKKVWQHVSNYEIFACMAVIYIQNPILFLAFLIVTECKNVYLCWSGKAFAEPDKLAPVSLTRIILTSVGYAVYQCVFYLLVFWLQ